MDELNLKPLCHVTFRISDGPEQTAPLFERKPTLLHAAAVAFILAGQMFK